MVLRKRGGYFAFDAYNMEILFMKGDYIYVNTLDSLLLIFFTAVLLCYCYKKRILLFSKLCSEMEMEYEEQKTAQDIQVPEQTIPFHSQMYQQSMPIQLASGSSTSTFCKMIGVDNIVIDDDADLENIVNNELAKLNAAGYTIQNVCPVSFGLFNGTGATRILFCITYNK